MRTLVKSEQEGTVLPGEQPLAPKENEDGSGPYPASPIDGDWTRYSEAGDASAANGGDGAERRAAIARRADLRAERRGFVPGHELDDRLAPEAEAEADAEPETRVASATSVKP